MLNAFVYFLIFETEFPDQIEESSTPITYLMVQAHLSKHGGRAKVAADQASELCNINTLSSPEQCVKVAKLYLKTADRLTMILKKLQMPTLRWKLVQALRLVAPMMRRVELVEEERKKEEDIEKQRKKEELAAISKGKRLKDKKKGSPSSSSPKSTLRKKSSVKSDSTETKTENKKDNKDNKDNKGTTNTEFSDAEEEEDDSTPRPTSSQLRKEAIARRPPSKQFQLPPGPMFFGGKVFSKNEKSFEISVFFQFRISSILVLQLSLKIIFYSVHFLLFIWFL